MSASPATENLSYFAQTMPTTQRGGKKNVFCASPPHYGTNCCARNEEKFHPRRGEGVMLAISPGNSRRTNRDHLFTLVATAAIMMYIEHEPCRVVVVSFAGGDITAANERGSSSRHLQPIVESTTVPSSIGYRVPSTRRRRHREKV